MNGKRVNSRIIQFCPGSAQDLSKICKGYAHDCSWLAPGFLLNVASALLKVYPSLAPGFPQGCSFLSRVCPRVAPSTEQHILASIQELHKVAQDLPGICAGSACSICPARVRALPSTCPSSAQDLPTLCPRSGQDLPKLCPASVQDLQSIEPRSI